MSSNPRSRKFPARCKRGKLARLESFADGALASVVPQEESRDFVYGVRAQTRTLSCLNPLRTPGTEATQETVTEPTTFFEDGRAGYDIQYLRMQEVIADALRQYARYVQAAQRHEMQWLMIAPGHTRPA